MFGAVILAACLAGLGAWRTPQAQGSDERLREQLHRFAPYVSMLNDLTPGRRSAAEWLTELSALEGRGEGSFDSDPKLASAWADVRAFFIASRTRLAPKLEASMAKMAPLADNDLEGIVARYYELARTKQIADWQADLDKKCRSAFAQIKPLLRKVAMGQVSDKPVATATTRSNLDREFVEIAHSSSAPLTNVTVHARLLSLEGRSADHFYFIPCWQPDQAYPLRIAVDWLPVGAEGTTGVVLDVISDQVISVGQRTTLEQGVPVALDRILDDVEASLKRKKQPAKAMSRLGLLRDQLAKYSDRKERAAALSLQARKLLDAELARVDSAIESKQARLRSLDASYDRYRRSHAKSKQTSPGLPVESTDMKQVDKERDSVKAAVAALRKEREEWNAGVR
jgi:hypothetical protein